MLIKLIDMYNEKLDYFNSIEEVIREEGVSLYGAGEFSYICTRYLLDIGIDINCIIDSDPSKQCKKIYGINVVEKNTEIAIKSKVVLVSTTRFVDEIIEENKDKFQYIVSFHQWFIMRNFMQLISLRSNFADKLSLDTFDSILYYRFNSLFNNVKNIFVRDHYFINEVFPSSKNEIFLDAGAYVGDTVEKFIINSEGIFKKIYAFEPGDKQFNSMKIRVNRLIDEWALNRDDIILENLGISNENKSVFFNSSNDILSNCIDEVQGNCKIDVVSIDSYLNGKPITFLKADIEGEELSMLKGAKNTILKYKPKMAISIYHKPDDFITILSFIKGLVPEYKFYLRHHSPTFAETVLYCVL